MVLNSWFFGVAGLLLLAAAPSAPATIGAEMKSMDKDGPEKAVTETVPAVVGAGVAKPRAIGGANLTHPEGALDDVSMEEDARQCFDGQIVDRGCDQRCKCIDGLLQCTARCAAPLLRIGTPTGDPDCFLQPVPGDECCSTLVCSSEGESFSSDGCWYKNQTYKTGEIFHDGCDLTCTCREDGTTNCTARCSPQNNTMTSDRCLSVADPKDSCCTVLYCDVNAADEGLDEDVDLDHPKLISAIPANSSTVMLNFDKMSVVDKVDAEISLDQKQWKHATSVGQAVIGLEPGKTYYFRVTSGGGMNSNVVSATLPTFHPNSTSCEFKGKQYEIGEEFHDNCTAYCICSPSGIECASIDCPTDFGLDVLDPTCLEWETVPPGFKPQPPHCCPKSVKCKNNGSCIYKGNLFENWQDIPDKLSGCQEKCFCSSGNITCRQRCSEVPETPPTSLNCNSKQAIMGHSADDECCPAWVCPSATQHIGLGVHQPNDPGSIAVHHLEAMDDGTVRLIFSVHPVLVGFHGRVELRYTADPSNNDISTWDQQVLAPPDDMIATPELEFELKGLMPDTEYRIKVTVVMRDLENSPTSPIVSVRTLHRVTPELSTTTLPPIIPVEPMMRITKVNSTWATVEWRTFTDYELQFIDGVQLRYKEIDGKVYQATPLIHRAVTSYTIEDLKPESQYEVGIFFIPFPEQSTELQALKTLFFNTTIENDPFKFELILDLHHLKSSSVEITWSGVPYPEDKYVNIFRAIYQYEGGREDMNTFKVAKRDSPAGTLITGLKPETRYRMWLEAYLTNGRIKKSNVKDFTTTAKAYSAAEPQEGKLESTPVHKESDYYGPLVGVSILAAITTLATVGLLVIIAKKHGHNKAPISAAVQRKSAPHTAAYDNPSYKSEMQHETMDL